MRHILKNCSTSSKTAFTPCSAHNIYHFLSFYYIYHDFSICTITSLSIFEFSIVSDSGLRCHDACLPPCPLTAVGERALSYRFKDLGVMPPSMGNAHSDMVHLSSAMKPAASEWPSSGLLVLTCMNGGSGVPEK